MLALTAASGSFALMQAVIVPVLGDVQSDLDTTPGWTAWTVSIYLLAASVATPLLGRLGDQFGKDRLLLVTLAIFTVGNLAAIFAWNIWSLIAFRALQGVAGAAYPLSFSIIRDEVSHERSGIAMGLISAMLGVGGGIGIVMSGVVGDHASWRWLFVIGTGLGLVALALAAACLPRSARHGTARLDIRGARCCSRPAWSACWWPSPRATPGAGPRPA